MASLNGLLLSLFHEAVKVALAAVAKRPARAFQRAHVSDRIPGAGPLPHGVVCLVWRPDRECSGVWAMLTGSPANRRRQVIAIGEQYEAGDGISGDSLPL